VIRSELKRSIGLGRHPIGNLKLHLLVFVVSLVELFGSKVSGSFGAGHNQDDGECRKH
jgi:hypothetical protein